MVSNSRFIQMAMFYKNVEEVPHFERKSFRISSKIFATLDEALNQAVVKLSEVDQSVFCLDNEDAVVPVPGKWGQKGWTIIELSEVYESVCQEMLRTAYCEVAPEYLANDYRHKL